MGRTFRYGRWVLLFVIVLILSLFTSIASLLVHTQLRNQLIAGETRKMEVEAALIGGILTDTMLRNDYVEGQHLLDDWVSDRQDVVVLDVTLDNGRTFFSFRRADNAETPLTLKQTFQYRNRVLSLTLCHDATELHDALAALRRSLFLLGLSLIGVTTLTLWYVLFRWMVRPMEEEITARTRDLNAARDSLEEKVAERTAALKKEVEIRRQTEAELRKLGMAVEQNPVTIFITDLAGRIEYVNPRFELMTGYARTEALGQTPRLLKSPETPQIVHETMWATVLAGRDWRGELKVRRKDGQEFWAHVSISPIKDPDGTITHFVAMHEDITERKQAEASMEESRHAAELANKAKTELLANMSHELRTPLNAIIGFSQTMRDGLFGPLGNDKYGEYVDHIHASGSHLLDLINDILDVAAVESGRLTLNEEEVDLADVQQSAIEFLASQAREAGVTLANAIGSDLPRLLADHRRLRQILLNVLSNAIKFTPQGGRIDSAARRDDDGGLVITVRDTGIGMDEQGLITAMTKFGQVDSSLARKHEGTGLGLPLTKGLVELHDGRLHLTSAPNEGTTVTIRLPPWRVLDPETVDADI
ncbi:sensor histidine kinase [Rhodospira trueperi]|uniref:histidine kinase n=1 Tax=Rhodospira trueperi TaxID=69960 RepID=A0A1G6WHW1_9PROT|nr:PAS domain S-box protein [Rhodospira trueperi]SDD65388.1 PAS domain S-box-containing protein [Rhodospira trueperi]